MTKKDYKAIAEVLRNCKPIESDDYTEGYRYAGWVIVVESMASMLAKDNERFKYGKFYRACDLYDGTNYDPTGGDNS